MSRRRLVVWFLLFAVIFCTSCSSEKDDRAAHALEDSFSAVVNVNNGQTEYSARITMSAVPEADTGIDAELMPRDGSVQYLSPESISDIYADRTDSIVKIGVSGVEITPSRDIAEKYVRLLDLLDVRARHFISSARTQIDGKEVLEAVFSRDGAEITVTFDCVTMLPISASCGDIQIQFSEFVYL